MNISDGGHLILAGTPIGNLADASESLRQALTAADIIAAEDTRRAKTLLAGLGIQTTASFVSYFDGNEQARATSLADALRGGATVLVITDAGMPTVSDPGFRIVREAIAADLPITVVPGPSAPLVALALSGLPSDRFCFEGFLPRKPGDRHRRLSALAAEDRTMIFFEASRRLDSFLADASDTFGPGRQASISRELTKTFEETKRGTLAELSVWAADGVRGEITIVVAGARQTGGDEEDALRQLLARIAEGEPPSAAAAAVAAESGVGRKKLYDAAVAARRETGKATHD